MANFMYVLKPTTKFHKVVCPVCAERGEVLDSCTTCRGSAFKKQCVTQYYVPDKPTRIDHIDRDPKNGVMRYWENTSEYIYETLYPTLNKYVIDIPYGIHLCHDDLKSAYAECDRINNFLKNESFDCPELALSDIAFNLNTLDEIRKAVLSFGES